MLEMLLYSIGIMYTPGPINLLGLNLGLNGKFKDSIGYFVGVGTAMVIFFLVFGYTGEQVIKKEYLIYISVIGSVYICYLAIKIMKSHVDIDGNKEVKLFSFKEGLLMQLMNPKGILATLPVATINFPANNINGIGILIASVLLATLAGFAPTSYSFIGQNFSNFIKQEKVLRIFNIIMGVMLLYVAFTIFYDHVYLVLRGISEY